MHGISTCNVRKCKSFTIQYYTEFKSMHIVCTKDENDDACTITVVRQKTDGFGAMKSNLGPHS